MLIGRDGYVDATRRIIETARHIEAKSVLIVDDIVQRRGYCDHFVTMCVCGCVGMCVWVCVLA